MSAFLELVCRSCGVRFESGVPLRPEHLAGVKLRALEVCPGCGTAADYRNEDYIAPEAPRAAHPPRPAVRDTPGRRR